MSASESSIRQELDDLLRGETEWQKSTTRAIEKLVSALGVLDQFVDRTGKLDELISEVRDLSLDLGLRNRELRKVLLRLQAADTMPAPKE
jgi:hypothetical protein